MNAEMRSKSTLAMRAAWPRKFFSVKVADDFF
jgi:hypothetical protein